MFERNIEIQVDEDGFGVAERAGGRGGVVSCQW